MKPITSLALVGCACMFAATDAFAQNLSERIRHVQQQRNRASYTDTDKPRILGTLLYTDVSVQFDETPARDAFNYLKTILGINIIARYEDDRAGFGIDPDTPITLDVENKPALTVVEMVLEQCSDLDPCTWQLRDGFLEVGTKERLSSRSAQEIRYYPIRDLLFEPPRFDNAPKLDLESALNQGGNASGGGGGGGGGGGFGGGGGGGGSGGGGIIDDPGDESPRISEAERAQQIVDLITESVEPDAWEQLGGSYASIRYYQGTLIVRAPDYIHRQIGGYPFAIQPSAPRASAAGDRRYVQFTGSFSDVTNADFRQTNDGTFGGSSD